MIPATTARVPDHTPARYNRRISRTTRANVAHYAAQGPQAIDRRLAELDREWDIERLLEANASSVVVLGCHWELLSIESSLHCRPSSAAFYCSTRFKDGARRCPFSADLVFAHSEKSMKSGLP